MSKKGKQRVPRTRNAGTQTEAQYFATIRSSLRNTFKWWKPMQRVKKDGRKRIKGKWSNQCCECEQWFPQKEIQIDHVVPCGSLRCYEDIPGFIERLTAEEPEAYQLVCKPCHQQKTNAERAARKAK